MAGLHEDDRYQGYFLDTTLVRNAMSEWRFPYHFIDFETAAVALPFHAGMRPYESLAFQFSHHLMEANGEVQARRPVPVRGAGCFSELSSLPER